MKILTVYAHPNPKSFCHAVLQQFTKGLEDAGHTNEVIDLYAIDFDPSSGSGISPIGFPPKTHRTSSKGRSRTSVRGQYSDFCSGLSPGACFCKKSPLEVMRLLRKRGPKDVREQQEKVGKSPGSGIYIPGLVRRVSRYLEGQGSAVCKDSLVLTPLRENVPPLPPLSDRNTRDKGDDSIPRC